MLPLILAAAAWVHTSHYDRIRDQTTTVATLQADNGPRAGPRAILAVNSFDNHLFAGLYITSGSLDCIDRCSVLVKVDSTPAKYIGASSTGLRAMMLDSAAADAIQQATDVDVEVRFLRGGSYQYHFHADAPLTPR